jgi:hypothetical protein
MQNPPKKLRTVEDMSNRELYDFLRDNGSNHEQAVAGVETRNAKRDASPAQTTPQAAPKKPYSAEEFLREKGPRGGTAFKEGLSNVRKHESTGAQETFLQGASLNFMDDVAELLGDEGYDERVEGFRKKNPAGSFMLEMGGSMTLPGMAALRNTGKAAKLGRTVAEGAVIGGTAGAGAAEGGLVERGKGFVKGAAVGAPAAAGGYGAAKAVGGLTRSAQSRAAGHVQKMVDEAPPSSSIAQRGKPVTAAEMMGQPGERALRGARAVSPEAAGQIDATLTTRRAGQEERILDDLLGATGIGGRTNTVKAAKSIMEERATNAKPLYDAAHSVDVKDGRIARFLDIPQFRQGYERAARIAAAEGERIPSIDQIQMEGASIPVKVLDYLKRGLDDVIDGGMSGGGMGKAEARALRIKRDEMLEVLDELVPEFMQARGYYKGESDLIEALEQGRKLWNMHPDEAAEILANPKLTDGERELMRKGMLESVANKVEGVASHRDVTKARPLAESTLDRKRLRLLFPDDASFEAFKVKLAEEMKMAAAENNIMGGSQTADKLADIAEMAGLDLGDAMQLATGNPRPLIEKAVGSKLAARARGQTKAKANAMTPFLLSKSPEEFSALGEALAMEGVRNRNVQKTAASAGRAASPLFVPNGRRKDRQR